MPRPRAIHQLRVIEGISLGLRISRERLESRFRPHCAEYQVQRKSCRRVVRDTPNPFPQSLNFGARVHGFDVFDVAPLNDRARYLLE
jgi:hypothetical protein